LKKEIEIKIGTDIIVATLLEKEAPNTCNAIWNALPFGTEAHYAKIAGRELYFMATPMILVEEIENPVKVHDVPIGAISYFPSRPYIQIFLGELLQTWNLNVNMFAIIRDKDLEKAKKIARKARIKPGDQIIVKRRPRLKSYE